MFRYRRARRAARRAEKPSGGGGGTTWSTNIRREPRGQLTSNGRGHTRANGGCRRQARPTWLPIAIRIRA
eukprot:3590146-Prymnesium_polylepis.1